MDRARIWPDFEDAWILHADDDIVVIDKPDGIPSQAADPSRPDDVVTRLARYLDAKSARMRRAGDAPFETAEAAETPETYLGTHQRLDRDTSGAIVLTSRREANAALAGQFEGRKVEKRYLACVTGWPKDKPRATLKDLLAKGADGKRVVVRAGEGGAPAVTHVKVLGREGDRALLELILETGRTHQARVQLAHAGAPIAGDTVYGGARAPRLLLHAHVLAFDHPGTGKRARFVAPPPAELESWLARGDLGEAIYADADALDRAVARAVRRRFALGRGDTGERATTAFRLINEAGDALPGLAVDVYGEHLVAQLYPSGAALEPQPFAGVTASETREPLLDRLAGLGFRGVYLKVRPKQANIVVDTRREELAPRLPVRGEAVRPSTSGDERDDELTIFEEGIPYVARLGDGLSTGIFLDQRANRTRVRELAAGQTVANLFAYTCAFSVAAAVGGAWRTVSVDASTVALEWGRQNLARAEMLDAAEHRFVAEDVFRWLARPRTKAERFDLVLLDPPSYSTTKARRFVADSDYAELAALALGALRPGGRLLACSNHRGMTRVAFRRALKRGAESAGLAVAQMKDLPDPSDFPVAAGAESHLKSVLVTLVREAAPKTEPPRKDPPRRDPPKKDAPRKKKGRV